MLSKRTTLGVRINCWTKCDDFFVGTFVLALTQPFLKISAVAHGSSKQKLSWQRRSFFESCERRRFCFVAEDNGGIKGLTEIGEKLAKFAMMQTLTLTTCVDILKHYCQSIFPISLSLSLSLTLCEFNRHTHTIF